MLYSVKERAISIDLIIRLNYELCNSELLNSLMLHLIENNEEIETGILTKASHRQRLKGDLY